jgi:DNA polymerase-1
MADVDILVDADGLVYRCGHAAEQRHWYLTWYDGDEENIAWFYTAERMRAFIEFMNIHPDEYDKQLVAKPEPLAYCLSGVKRCLEDIKNQVDVYLYEKDQVHGNIKLFLTGEDNFRDRIATIKGYKANRDRSTRPYWYKEIREYMIKTWQAEVVHGFEADDRVSMLQYAGTESGSTIICTIDKDLKMVPGHHYNYAKKEAHWVTRDEGFRFFCHQMLTGDTSDNIPGLRGVGDKGAHGLLKNCSSREAMFKVVKEQYKLNVEKYPEHHKGLSWQESLIENGRLLWMMRHEDDLWFPPLQSVSLKEYLGTLEPADADGDLDE